MEIRPARDDDFDAIAAITNHYITTTSIHFGYEHERCGFTHVGTFADAGWKNGVWHAVDWWQKRFSTTPQGPT